jgi:hypothetical protein
MLRMDSKHMRVHVKPVLCPYIGCPVRVAEQRDMGRHVETHLPEDSRLHFECPDCKRKILREDNLLRHRENLHGIPQVGRAAE